jgi:hypothetical protein
MRVTQSDPSDVPPDWSGSAVELTCPLCGYDLRGLATPRCPECGFAFTWAELLDAKRDRHPWLFEHARRGRQVKAFLATYFRTCLPQRYWRQVTPANPVRLRRLLLYWLIAGAGLAMVFAVPLVQMTLSLAKADLDLRGLYKPAPNQPGHYVGPPLFKYRTTWSNTYVWGSSPYAATTGGPSMATSSVVTASNAPGSLTMINTITARPWTVTVSADDLNAAAPRVPSLGFLVQLWNAWTQPSPYMGPVESPTVAFTTIVLAWPALSAAALLLFQTSMRRAKVSPAHVLRAAVYGCDFGLLAVAAAAVLYGITAGDRPLAAMIPVWPLSRFARPMLLAIALCAVVATYRLSFAYGRYLRFHRPLLTVLASQLLVALLVLVVLAQTTRLF